MNRTDDKSISEEEFIIAIDAVFHIFDYWRISDEDKQKILGNITEGDLIELKKGMVKDKLETDLVQRVSHLLNIWTSIQILISKCEIADRWIRTPNTETLFKGKSPLEKVISGDFNDLGDVTAYLHAQLG